MESLNEKMLQPGFTAGTVRMQSTSEGDVYQISNIREQTNSRLINFLRFIDVEREDKKPESTSMLEPISWSNTKDMKTIQQYRPVNRDDFRRYTVLDHQQRRDLCSYRRHLYPGEVLFTHDDEYFTINTPHYECRITSFKVICLRKNNGKPKVTAFLSPNLSPDFLNMHVKHCEKFGYHRDGEDFWFSDILEFLIVAFSQIAYCDFLTYQVFPRDALHMVTPPLCSDIIHIVDKENPIHSLGDFFTCRAIDLAAFFCMKGDKFPLCNEFYVGERLASGILTPTYWTGRQMDDEPKPIGTHKTKKNNDRKARARKRKAEAREKDLIENSAGRDRPFESQSKVEIKREFLANVRENSKGFRASRKGETIVSNKIHRPARSEVRKQREADEIDRQLPVIEQTTVERPPENEGAYDKYDKRIQFGPWFLRTPVATQKQLLRMKKIYPNLLTGEFDLKLMSKAFFQMNMFLFQQQYFITPNDWSTKNMIKAFHSVMEGRSLVRLQEHMKPALALRTNAILTWLKNYRLFTKVFCGTRESRIGDNWDEARRTFKGDKFKKLSFESQGLGDWFAKKTTQATQSVTEGVTTGIKNGLKDFFVSLPETITQFVYEAAKTAIESFSKAVAFMKEKILECVNAIRDFLYELMPDPQQVRTCNRGTVLFVMAVLIVVIIMVPTRMDGLMRTLLGLAMGSLAVCAGFNVAQDYMSVWEVDDEMFEIQSWDGIWKAVTMVGALFSLRSISSMFSIGRNIKPVCADMKEFFVKAFDWIYRSVTGEHYWPEYDEVTKFREFITEIQSLFAEPDYALHYKVVKSYALRTVALGKKVPHFKSVFASMKCDANTSRYFTEIISSVLDKSHDVQNTSMFFRDRIEPVCIVLSGAANQGKSKISEFMPKAIYDNCQAAMFSEFPLTWSPDMVFTPSADQFADGLSVYTQVWKEDDFLQTRDPNLRAAEALNFIKLVSCSQYSKAAAKLEMKGNCFATMPIVFMTTNFNVDDPPSVKSCKIEDPNAFRRRCHLKLIVEKVKHCADPIAERDAAWKFIMHAPDPMNELYEGQKAAFAVLPCWVQKRLSDSNTGFVAFNWSEVTKMASEMIVERTRVQKRHRETAYDFVSPVFTPTEKKCPISCSVFDDWVRRGLVRWTNKVDHTASFIELLKDATRGARKTEPTHVCKDYFFHMIVRCLIATSIEPDAARRMFTKWWNDADDDKPPPTPPDYISIDNDDFNNIGKFFDGLVSEEWDRKFEERKDYLQGKEKVKERFESQGLMDYLPAYTQTCDTPMSMAIAAVRGTFWYMLGYTCQDLPANHDFNEFFKKHWVTMTPFDMSQHLETTQGTHQATGYMFLNPDYTIRKANYNYWINAVKRKLQGDDVDERAPPVGHPFYEAVNAVLDAFTPRAAMDLLYRNHRMPVGVSAGAEIPYWMARLVLEVSAICHTLIFHARPEHLSTESKSLEAHGLSAEEIAYIHECKLQCDYAQIVPEVCGELLKAMHNHKRTIIFYFLMGSWIVLVGALVYIMAQMLFKTLSGNYKPFSVQSINREKMARLGDKQRFKVQYEKEDGTKVEHNLTKDDIKDDEIFFEVQSGVGDQINNKINKFTHHMRTLHFIRQLDGEYVEMEAEVLFSGRRAFPVAHVFFARGTTWDTVDVYNGETRLSSHDMKTVKITSRVGDLRDIAYVDFGVDFPEYPSLKGQFIAPESITDMDKFHFYRLSRCSTKGQPQILVYETGHLSKKETAFSELLDPNGVASRWHVNNIWISINGEGMPGDCGKPLVAANITTGQVWIMGIHIGKNNCDTYFSQLSDADIPKETAFVTQNGIEIRKAGVYIPKYVETTAKYAQEFDGRLVAMGTVKSSFIPSETNFVASPFQGNDLVDPIYPISSAPAKLKPFILEDEDIKEELIKPLPKAIAKMTSAPVRTFPLNLRRLFEKFPELISDGFVPRTRRKFRMLTLEEALAKLDMNASVGYDMQCKGFTSRHQLWRKNDDGMVEWVHPVLRESVMELWNAMRAGHTLKNVVSACLKDELRDLGRVNAGKTRLFCVGSLSHLIITVMVMGDVVFYMKDHRTQTDVCIGTNPHGWEWTFLNRKLKRWINGKFGGGDFSNYDSSILSGFAYGLYCVMKWYMQWDDQWELWALYCVCMSSIGPLMVIIREIYWMDWMNSSGGWLTGFLNSFVNVVIFNYYVIIKNDEHGLTFTRAQVIVIIIYGDDNAWNVSPEYEKYFDMYKLAEFIFMTFGMTYTTPDKGDIAAPYMEMDSIKFLCRTMGSGEIVHPCLERDSITGMLLWIRKPKRGVTIAQQLSVNVEQAAMEFFHYGEEIFMEETKKLKNYCYLYSIPYTGRSYSEYQDRWHDAMMSKY